MQVGDIVTCHVTDAGSIKVVVQHKRGFYEDVVTLFESAITTDVYPLISMTDRVQITTLN